MIIPALTPDDPVVAHVHGRKDTDAGQGGEGGDTARVVSPLRRCLEIPIPADEMSRDVRGADIQPLPLRIVGTGRPVSAAIETGGDDDPLLAEEGGEDPALIDQLKTHGRDIHKMRHDGISHRIGLGCSRGLAGFLGDRSFLDPEQGFAVLAVQDIDPAGLVDLGDGLAGHAVDRHIEQHHRIAGVIVPEVMMDLLVVPAVLAGGGVHRDDGHREQIVSRAHRAIEIRSRIGGGEIQETQLRIHGGCLPDCGAAVLPDLIVPGPGVMAVFAGTRDGVEGPDQAAIVRVVGLDLPADTVFRAGETADDQAVVIEGRAGDGIALLPALCLDRPDGLAALLIERHDLAVELADEDLALAESHAPVGPTAADRGEFREQVGPVFPEYSAGLHTQGKDIIRSGADVDHAVMHQGLRLAGILGIEAGALEMGAPDAFQLRDIFSVDVCEGGVALVVQIPAVGDPAPHGVAH